MGLIGIPLRETSSLQKGFSLPSRGSPLASITLPSNLWLTFAVASLLIISTEEPGPMPVASVNGIRKIVSF